MICPHCEKSLLRKERTGNICSHCRRGFALDPKTNALTVSDLKVRRVMAKLTRDGQVPCTPGHLWYALSRSALGKQGTDYGGPGCALFFGVMLGLMGLGMQASLIAGVGGVVAVLGFGYLIATALLPSAGRGRVPMRRDTFRTAVIKPWLQVYGTLPAGMVDDTRYPQRRPDPAEGHAGTILCPDPSIASLLMAQDLPARYGLGLVADLADLPPHGPVIVLHDADAHGMLFAARARAALPGRVVDAGLTLRAARGPARVVAFRGPRPDRSVMADLTALADRVPDDLIRDELIPDELMPDELTWLAKGWGHPLVGVRPARLLAGVSRVADRVTGAADPDRRRAASIGFMTWPGEGR